MPPVPVQSASAALSRVRPVSVWPPVPLIVMPPFASTLPVPLIVPDDQVRAPPTVTAPLPASVPPSSLNALRVEAVLTLSVPPDSSRVPLLVTLWTASVPVECVTVMEAPLMTTSSAAPGFVPVLQLLPTFHAPLTELIQVTVA